MRRFMEESLITVKEVADYLKLKEQTVYLLARQNKIPSLRVGGSLRFKKSQIDAWLLSSPHVSSKLEGPKQKVLIVDDEELVRNTLKRMVELHGVAASTAEGGPQAVDLMMQEKFKMVFLDLYMPGMNGVDTLRALKEINKELVFVVVTALDGDNDLFRRILEHAPVSVIPKPFTVKQIGDVLEPYFELISSPK
jgi:excisionase family DNA binding protein